MHISKIALLMALTASGAIAAPLRGSEAALELRGVDVKPAATELNVGDVHDEDALLTRRSGFENWHQSSDKRKGLYTINEDNRERLERQGGGRQYGMVEKEKPKAKAPQHPTSGTRNEPSRAETEKDKKKKKYGKNGR